MKRLAPISILLSLTGLFLVSCHNKPKACIDFDRKYFIQEEIDFNSINIDCSTYDGSITWDYGDGTSDNTGIHTYSEPGEYTVTQTVKNGFKQDETQATVRVGHFKISFLEYKIFKCNFADSKDVTFWFDDIGITGRSAKWSNIEQKVADYRLTLDKIQEEVCSYYSVNYENCIYSPSGTFCCTKLPIGLAAEDDFQFNVSYPDVWFNMTLTYTTEP